MTFKLLMGKKKKCVGDECLKNPKANQENPKLYDYEPLLSLRFHKGL